MSDFSQGEGWWQASDGLWYQPELHPDAPALHPEAATQATTTQTDSSTAAPGGGRTPWLIGAAVLTVAALAAVGWLVFGGDNGGGTTAADISGSLRFETDVVTEFGPLRFEEREAVFRVTGGVVVVVGQDPSDDDIVAGVDAESGVVLWSAEAALVDNTPLVATALAVTDDHVLYRARDGSDQATSRVVAVDLQSGDEIWTATLPVPFLPQVVAGRLLYTDRTSAEAVALDSATGDEAWRVSLGEGGFAGPTTTTLSVVHEDDGRRTGLDLVDGTERWQVDLPDDVDFRRQLDDGPIIGETETGIIAIDPATGDQLWSHPLDDEPDCISRTTDGKAVLVFRDDGGTDVIDRNSGEVSWSVSANADQHPAIATDSVIVLSDRALKCAGGFAGGSFEVRSTADGSVLWSREQEDDQWLEVLPGIATRPDRRYGDDLYVRTGLPAEDRTEVVRVDPLTGRELDVLIDREAERRQIPLLAGHVVWVWNGDPGALEVDGEVLVDRVNEPPGSRLLADGTYFAIINQETLIAID